jgi:hypothetical protein
VRQGLLFCKKEAKNFCSAVAGLTGKGSLVAFLFFEAAMKYHDAAVAHLEVD